MSELLVGIAAFLVAWFLRGRTVKALRASYQATENRITRQEGDFARFEQALRERIRERLVNKLTNIKGYCQLLLQRTQLAPEYVEMVNTILQGATELEKLALNIGDPDNLGKLPAQFE
jgi:signal transduction histidine kinase